MRIYSNGLPGLQRKIAWLLLFSLVALCFVTWLISANKRNIQQTSYWINHTYDVIELIQRIDMRIPELESFNRPYKENNPTFYSSGLFSFREDLNLDLARLQQLTEDEPQQRSNMHTLSASMQTINSFHDSIPADPAAISNTIRSIRANLRVMMEDERYLLTQRQLTSRFEDGKHTWTLITGTVLAFLFIVLILAQLNKDIVLRKAAEAELQKRDLWLQSILQNTSSLIYIKDLSGRYIMASRSFLDVLDMEEKDVINKTDHDFCDKEVADHFKELDDEVIRTGKTLEREEISRSPKGDRNLLLTKFPLLDKDNKVFGISGIATDITERVQQHQALIAATKEAQDARGMQEIFLANMSHEIRTPMNGIQGMTNLLIETELNEQQQEYTGVIRRSVNNLLVIINDILDFSKIRAGKLAIEKIDFRLEDVIESVQAIFAHRVQKKGLSFAFDVSEETPGHLKGDPYRLNQVLINLIGNAIKFTEKGSVTVRVSVKRRGAEQITLSFVVSDTGIGIPGHSQPYIFESFSQAGQDITRRFGGTGLGLAICNQLLKLQGGSISVASTEGQGSTFSFEIPYEYSNQQYEIAPAPTRISDYTQQLKGIRFLVAEDNEINQQLVDHVLKKAGAAVTIANNGEEAISCLHEDPTYDCIIMDLQMPVIDGYAATQHIRTEMQLQTPIIAMTATAMIGEQLRCIEVGMNDYMTKPFEFADLYRRVIALLESRTIAAAPFPGMKDPG